MYGIGMAASLNANIVQLLFDEGLIRTWYRNHPEGWILKSGQWSPFYIQLRPLVAKPEILASIGESMAALLREKCPDASKLLGVAMAGIPIAIAASLNSGIAAAYTRKIDPQEHGEHAAIEGELVDGDEVIVIDDVVTRFDSKREAIDQVMNEAARLGINVRCRTVCVVVNRLQLTQDELEKQGVNLYSLVDFTADSLQELKSLLHPVEYHVISNYLRNPAEFQSDEIRTEIMSLSNSKP